MLVGVADTDILQGHAQLYVFYFISVFAYFKTILTKVEESEYNLWLGLQSDTAAVYIFNLRHTEPPKHRLFTPAGSRTVFPTLQGLT